LLIKLFIKNRVRHCVGFPFRNSFANLAQFVKKKVTDTHDYGFLQISII
jgi:hypothetical protein